MSPPLLPSVGRPRDARGRRRTLNEGGAPGKTAIRARSRDAAKPPRSRGASRPPRERAGNKEATTGQSFLAGSRPKRCLLACLLLPGSLPFSLPARPSRDGKAGLRPILWRKAERFSCLLLQRALTWRGMGTEREREKSFRKSFEGKPRSGLWCNGCPPRMGRPRSPFAPALFSPSLSSFSLIYWSSITWSRKDDVLGSF